jgi:hypothetical protein
MKCAGSGCNRTTWFVTDAKDFMEMNMIAQKNVTTEDATVLSGTCYKYDAGFSGRTCLEHFPLHCKDISCVSYKKDYYGVKCQCKF